MTALLKALRHIWNIPELHENIDRLEKQVESLKDELSRAYQNRGPSFSEVSKDFDFSLTMNDIIHQATENILPLVDHSIMDMIRLVGEPRSHHRPITAQVAYDHMSMVNVIRFRIPEYYSEIQVYHGR